MTDARCRGKDKLGQWVEGYLVVNPFGKPFIVHYRNLTPMWSEVNPQTIERIS